MTATPTHREAPLTIATWNCCGRALAKWPTIAGLGDLVIVQECHADLCDTAREHGWSASWSGIGAKGLAVLAAPGWTVEPLEQVNPWWVSVRVLAPVQFVIVGFWAMAPTLTKKTYTRQATIMVEAIAGIAGPLVIGGDFNSWDAKAHYAALDALRTRGLLSVYHQHRAVVGNSEPEPTLFFQWKADRGYHIDLLFAPADWVIDNVTVGTFEQYPGHGLSDHVPVGAQLIPAVRAGAGRETLSRQRTADS